jgi:uncharacterized membrane protein
MEQNYDMHSTDTTILQSRLHEMGKHMKFVGTFLVVVGVLYCLTIIGAIIGIPYLIAGLRLRESADSYHGYASNSDARQLLTAFEKQSSFFFIMKVLIIIAIVFFVLYVLAIILFVGFWGNDFFNLLDTY